MSSGLVAGVGSPVATVGFVLVEALLLYGVYGALTRLVGPHLGSVVRSR